MSFTNFFFRIRSLAVLAAGLIFVLGSLAGDVQFDPKGKVGAIESKLEVERGGERIKLRVGDEVKPKDFLRTGGKARVGFRDGLTINMGKGTRVRIVEHNGESGQTILEVEKGRVRVERFDLPEGGKVEIRTPAATIHFKNGHIFLKVSGGATEIAVFSGDIQVSNAGNDIPIVPGRKFKIHSGGQVKDEGAFHYWDRYVMYAHTSIKPKTIR